MIVDGENILKLLGTMNPWWRDGSLNADYAKPMKRFAFYETMGALLHPDIRRMVILTGLRRVGKTTVMYQMIECLLKRGIEPGRILYVSFDHPLLKFSGIDEILGTHKQNVYPGDDVYYFFDEIHYAENWDSWLKTLYDTNKKCHVVATGSASPVLLGKSIESGVGRWRNIAVPTLSFYEYCCLMGLQCPELPSDAIPEYLHSMKPHEQHMLFQKISPLMPHFSRYLMVGGFPELAMSKDSLYAQSILRYDIVDKVLKRDIPALYNIRSIADLEKIFIYLCFNSSSIISMETISKEMGGVTRPTVEKYIQYLEGANLIYVSNPVDISGKKILKSRPKIYIADAAIRNAVLTDENILSDPAGMGIVVETAVYKHVQAFYQSMSARVGYCRNTGKNGEIDIVVEYPDNSRTLIEVKYREQYSLSKNAPIITEAKKDGDAIRAFLITKKEMDFGPLEACHAIYRIPAYAFLYLLGNIESQGSRVADHH
jgi:predicted AAA+ superfamily ATPase